MITTEASAQDSRTGPDSGPGEPAPVPARPWVIASGVGGGLGLVVFIGLLSRGFESLTMASFSSNFYDLQARALLAGHTWVPDGAASLEGIQYRGHTYIYFGPFLALIRLPVMWLAPGASGHLSQASMIVAAIVLVAATSWLGWQIRALVAGVLRPGRRELAAQAGFCAALPGGSVALYLAGSPSVYFETELWGCALAIAALAAFLSFARKPSTPSAALLGAAALGDALTRLSVAAGPLLLLFVAAAWAGWQKRRRLTALLATGSLVAVGLPCWFNWAKFGSLTSVPWARQVVSLQNPSVQAFYRHHSVLSLTNLTSTMGWYLRPWTLLTTGLFPFFGFRSHPAVASPGSFLAVGRAASIPSSMPLLFLLAGAGLILLLRPLRPTSQGAWPLRLCAAAAAASGATVMVFDTIANRYLADLLPALVVCSLVAVSWITARWDRWPRPARTTVITAAAGLALVSMLVNLSLGLQEAFNFAPSPTPQDKARLVSWQLTLHQRLPVALPFPASEGGRVPADPVPGQLFVQSGCAGVYQYNGPIWNQLEVGAAGGRRVLDTHVPLRRGQATEPLLVAGTPSEPGSYQYFSIQYSPGRYRLLYESRPWDAFEGRTVVVSTAWYPLPASGDLRLVLTIAGTAPDGGLVEEAQMPGGRDFFPEIPVQPTRTWTVGRFPDGSGRYTGSIRLEPVATPLCDLARRAIRSDGH